MVSSNETESYSVCQHHQELCEATEAGSSNQKKLCAACGKTAQRIANLKTSVAVSKSVGKKIVIGEFLCTRCAGSQLADPDSFYQYMSEEHRLAQLDEQGEAGGGDESFMDTDVNAGAAKLVVDYSLMEESDEEDEDPGFTLSQGSDTSQGTDYKADFYKQQAEKSLAIIQETFKDMNLPSTSFQPERYKSRKYKWTMQGKLLNLWIAEAKMLFPNSDPQDALAYMEKSFSAYRDMVTQEL